MIKRSIHDYPDQTEKLIADMIQEVPYEKVLRSIASSSNDWLLAVSRGEDVPTCVLSYVNELVLINNTTERKDRLESTFLNKLIKDERTNPSVLSMLANSLTHATSLNQLLKNQSVPSESLEVIADKIGLNKCRYYLLKHANTSERLLEKCCQESMTLQDALALHNHNNLSDNLCFRIEALTRIDASSKYNDFEIKMKRDIRFGLTQSKALNVKLALTLFEHPLPNAQEQMRLWLSLFNSPTLSIFECITLIEECDKGGLVTQPSQLNTALRIVSNRKDLKDLPELMQSYSSLLQLHESEHSLTDLMMLNTSSDFANAIIDNPSTSEIQFLKAGMNTDLEDRYLGANEIQAIRQAFPNSHEVWFEELANVKALPLALSIGSEKIAYLSVLLGPVLKVIIEMLLPQTALRARVCRDCLKLICEITDIEHHILKEKIVNEVCELVMSHTSKLIYTLHPYLLEKRPSEEFNSTTLFNPQISNRRIANVKQNTFKSLGWELHILTNLNELKKVSNVQRHDLDNDRMVKALINGECFAFTFTEKGNPLSKGFTVVCCSKTGVIIEASGFCGVTVHKHLRVKVKELVGLILKQLSDV
ncbi:hypothetical protein VIBNIFTn2_120108 [Vibrio nigripulchritudo FTn2]|uniref:hypothetical protein n=1 Tax=Vibrio nigripulchritudo TaxID=28173 RepID=UPI0003B1E90C|nr:hypothetical protein [Vibrio nigripulchritudo]CCN40126.1 hypothetical protein VIBNIFTn2_120108 [Vibrio nigripulchritudo FTn2]